MKRGSISVYLCLTLCVILSLIFACISSARYSCGRAAVSCAVDEGMFSLFSNYDKTLFDDYGLLFIDGGYGEKELKTGNLAQEVKKYAEEVISPETGIFGTDPKSLYRIKTGDIHVTGFTLATDSNYQKIREQICDFQLMKTGTSAVKGLADKLGTEAGIFRKYGFEEEPDLEQMMADYEENKAEAEKLKPVMQESEENTESTETVEIPENFVNPLDNMETIKSIGLYDFILPEGKKVSAGSIDTAQVISKREKNSGMGILPKEEHSAAERILLSEFGIDNFTGFLSNEYDGDLKYRIEYVIAGKNSDDKNLKSVLNRILLIRFGLNYFSLMSDASKMAELTQLAAVISVILLMPELEPAFEQVLMLLFSYCEGMMDLKTLLQGNEVPVFKNAGSWQLSWDILGIFGENTKVTKKSQGLDYNDYLRVLLYMLPEDELTDRTMDMLEYTKRNKDKNDSFCLDNCVSDLEIELAGSIGNQEITINRSYGY